MAGTTLAQYPSREWITATNLAHLRSYDSRSDPDFYDLASESTAYFTAAQQLTVQRWHRLNLIAEFRDRGWPEEGWQFEFHCEANPDYQPEMTVINECGKNATK